MNYMKAINFFSSVWYFVVMAACYNPLSFLILSLFATQSAARSLYEKTLGANSPKQLVAEFYWDLINWCRNLMPWRCRKSLLLEGRLKQASFDEQLKIFHQGDKVRLINERMLSQEVLHHVLPDCGNLMPQAAKQIAELTPAEFDLLMRNNHWSAVGDYLMQQRSEDILRRLADYAINHPQDNAIGILRWYIKRNSLPKRLIAPLMKSKIKDDVLEALACYGERQIILFAKEDASLFETICKKMGEEVYVQKENQRLLDATLYTIYHQYGGKLDDDAIEYFLSKENVGMAKLIFKWEFLKNNRELSELQLALVSSSPVLTKEWLKLQTDDDAAV